MTDEQLRALVREIVARQLDTRPPDARPPSEPPRPLGHGHASHGRFVLVSDSSGACLIEPQVECTHCGFCESYGH